MIEYYIENIYTEQTRPVWGYNWKDACKRHCLIESEWIILYADYVD